ncbi:MAG: hypothetical protein UT39_C0002G0075 [Candidatus Woesebacteria bacterium GW2011_GWA1_39_21]|uniref:Uncharacterized protein n=1 Tax=Candidatus Woesebacteria bacterium GW2011_GWA1_39_21 TaxID=1618550 RepID=A0A0G0N6S7_9BACT|nr:MAG: hypothetical protein UT39_C0002G0075 [Candidatus Woesebacteria bacterium GW2011_GWA1_39_21]
MSAEAEKSKFVEGAKNFAIGVGVIVLGLYVGVAGLNLVINSAETAVM